ncbi:MAG: cyclic nucleotide-binding domain-containing protein [Betaproteobacteria bacterium]
MAESAVSTLGWTLLVTIGYPVLVIGLLELRRFLAGRFPRGASICTLIQFTILPTAAAFILLTRISGRSPDETLPRLLLSLLVIAGINAALAAINAVVRSGVLQADWARRIPALVLDLLRLAIVLVAGAFVASRIWGVDLGNLLAALGVGSVVLGLALQDTVSGLFAGISLISGRHFKEGDWIESNGVAGKIVQMDWRSVTVETLDDEHLVVFPNSELAKAQFMVINTDVRPFGQSVRVKFAYTVPPARASDAIENALKSVDLILQDPAPGIDIVGLGDDGIEFEVTFHAMTRFDGDEGLTHFFRKLWYICAREGLQFAGAANRKYRADPLALPGSEHVAETLSGTGIFPRDANGFDALVRASRVALYDEGEILLHAQDAFRKLFIVLEGELSAQIEMGEGREVIQVVGSGEFFVNRAYLTGGVAGYYLSAALESTVLVVETQDVLEFLNANPALARKFEEAIDLTERALRSFAPTF